MKEFDFQNGIPSNNDINPNSILLSISGGSLVCTTTTNNFISGINPNFGTNLSSSIVYQIEFDFDPGNMTSMDGLYLIPYDLDEVNNLIYNGALFWGYGSVPAAGHYSYTYTPVYTGSNFSTRIAFNALGSMGSGHYFKVDNVKMCSTMGVVASYSADITSNTDYYPGGMQMPGRTWVEGNEYRYSHNGHEREDEIFTGAQSAECWMYDSRLLRRWEMDPVDYDWQSPYACFDNNPILFADPHGLFGDPPGTITKMTRPGAQLGSGNTALDIQFKNIQNSFSLKSTSGTKLLNTAGSVARTLGKTSSIFLLDNSDGYGLSASPGMRFENPAPIQIITFDPSILTEYQLSQIKQRVESGKGSFNDHQIYNKTFPPKAKAPYTTQSHHVIPVKVFQDISIPLIEIASRNDEFQKTMDRDSYILNRLPLGADVHGNHPAYNNYVTKQLVILYEVNEHKLTSELAWRLTEELAGKLKGLIIESLTNNPGMRLNDIFKAYNAGKAKAGEKVPSKLRSKFDQPTKYTKQK